jgi:uncharacterized protein YlxP (DUF503 family)
MIIGACVIELHLPGNGSLKGKRSVVKPILARLHQEFNVSAAEVGRQDAWQVAEIGLALIANDAGHVQTVLQRAVGWIEANRPDVQVVDYSIEVIT